MFALPKALKDPPKLADLNSKTSTRPVPKYQAITSPMASREKGDWGLKRPLPLKQTMATTTPLVRIKQFDSTEKITDYASAADHALSLEKFGEMRIAMTVPHPKTTNTRANYYQDPNPDPLKSVFEEERDFTVVKEGDEAMAKRWKFHGPWLANMSDGDFYKYLDKHVRPRRVEFRDMLRTRLASKLTEELSNKARESGQPLPAKVNAQDITEQQLTEFTRDLRNHRVDLYYLVSVFLDLAPLTQLGGVSKAITNGASHNPYGQSGPPPSHPSAGISYLRTNAFMENHAMYGPQSQKSPTLARIIRPRLGGRAAKMGVGGFVADVPGGNNDFNDRRMTGKFANSKAHTGVAHLDVSSFGGAKAYVEAQTANVDARGHVVIATKVAEQENQLVAKEAKGQTTIYNDSKLKRTIPSAEQQGGSQRIDQVANEILKGQPERAAEKEIVGSSKSYGLDS